MDGKLIKMVEGYTLSVTGSVDDLYGISNHQLAEEHQLQKLSLKNCEAIKNGYDLDELYLLMVSSIGYEELDYNSFEIGFLNAINFFSDKKFSEEDVIKIAEYIRVASQSTPNVRTKELFDEYQSLQQTECDVEIEMGGYKLNCDGEKYGFPDLDQPKLDAEGCLILKRK